MATAAKISLIERITKPGIALELTMEEAEVLLDIAARVSGQGRKIDALIAINDALLDAGVTEPDWVARKCYLEGDLLFSEVDDADRS